VDSIASTESLKSTQGVGNSSDKMIPSSAKAQGLPRRYYNDFHKPKRVSEMSGEEIASYWIIMNGSPECKKSP